MTVSVSSESASLARTQSCRSRASATVVRASPRSSSLSAPPAAWLTKDRTASSRSAPPRCSTPLGRAEYLDPVDGPAQHGRVEGAPAEVVDGDRLALGHVAGVGVVRGRGLGLGDGPPLLDPGDARDVLEELTAVGAPVGRVGQHDEVRRAALLGHDPRQHVAQQSAEQLLHGEGRAAQHDRRRIAEPTFDLRGNAGRVAHRPAVGGVTSDQRAVLAHVHGGRHDDGPVP